MDYEKLLSGYKAKACIISVDIYPDDHYGNIRIVAGNKAHCDDMLKTMHKEFIPGSPYAEYLPENKNFEDFCYRSSILGQPLHTYVELPFMNLWLNMFLLPLESDKENTGYCLYLYDVAPKADSGQRASLSADTAATVLETCIKLRGSSNIKETINEVVNSIREICESDHCCILLVDKDTRKCETFSESINPGKGVKPMDTFLDDGFFDIAQTWDGTIGGSTCIIIKNQQDREWLESVNPLWYQSLTGAGVYNIVLFPLIYNDITLGYMWSLNFNEENTVKIKETLELTTFFIASEIANYQLLQKLKIMSTMDMLTGVKNRNAMNNTISSIIDGKIRINYPYSVIFTDLNGLKRINDQNGHTEGDNLLKTTADIFIGIFYDADVFRAGGDEFMILAYDMDEKMLEARLKRVAEQTKKNNIQVSIGTFVVHEGDDIRTAMRKADERMYADKNAYYDKHPELKYR
ncbi:MAG: sensor domain-containing diguanylate cyclase [Clostridiales bacterium]|nr:sensor domain-containing diguanylate cyclase [Clostridiales bacterium]